MMIRTLFIFLFTISTLPLQAEQVPGELRQFFGQYCVSCHGPAKQEADFRIDTLGLAQTPEAAEYWQLVLDNLHLGDMPPAKHDPQPSIEEIEPVTRWIEGELERARLAMKGATGEVVLRRLNKTEYENTIYDLFDIRGKYTLSFPADAEEHGFDNNGASLMLSKAQINAYFAAADFILDRAIAPEERPKVNRGVYTLHDINKRSWSKWEKRLEQRLKIYDSLSEREKRKTDELKERVENQDYSNFTYPAWTGTEMRAPTPKDGVGVDALMFKQNYNASAPDTRDVYNVREPGWYRFTITAYALKNDGEPVRLEIRYGGSRNGQRGEVLDVIYLTDDSPRDYSYDIFLEPGESVQWQMLDGPINGSQALEHLREMDGPFIAIRKSVLEGPIYEPWPPKGHRTLFGDIDPETVTPDTIGDVVRHFGGRLFRRPLSPDQVDRYAQLYRNFVENETPADALRITLKTMMMAPQFLYHIEPPTQLDPYSLASRLSYFLWRSTPDDALLEAAASGQLSDPQGLYQQVERMLADPKSKRFVEDFTDQWLRTDEVGVFVPDSNLYPEYDRQLEEAMVEETQGFMAEMFYNDLPLSNLIDSDWTILNERLAEHYGIDGVEGPEFRKVKLDKSETLRGGILTHASILTVTSNGTTTSPIVRGVWMLDYLLGTPVPPPPPDVPVIEPDIRGATNIKEQLAAHRTIPQCASCHVKIDPFGIALENFDVIGGWRENYRALDSSSKGRRPELVEGQPVLSNDTIPNIGPFSNFREFRQILLDQQNLVYHNMASQLARFALGRNLTFADRDDLQTIANQTMARDAGMRTMVHALIQSPLFIEP